MISVIIPISNQHEYTNECIENLLGYAVHGDKLDIIVVDNASQVPYKSDYARVIRNEKNVGFWPSLLQGMSVAEHDICVTLHNDVFIWEYGWDKRVMREFANDEKLALAGLFGSKGVARDGGRMYPESNMLGLKYGTHGNLHGRLLTETHPSVVFDSLCMMFRRSLLYTISYRDIPPHHWTDRLVTLRLVKAGYHAITIGIGFDHGGGFTSTTPAYGTFAEDWCREQGLEMENGSWDMTLYTHGARMFWNEIGAQFLEVDDNFTLRYH